MLRRVALFIALLLLVLAVSVAYAVGTITFTSLDVGGRHTKYTAAWVSDASGDVSGNSAQFNIMRGSLRQAQFTPDGGGTQPTDLYDATFVYSGVDVLDGVAANLSNSIATIIMFDPPLFYDGTSNFDLVISNAGNAKGGTFVLWVAP
jgi:hypothetical protein